jgi:hypothetical protein
MTREHLGNVAKALFSVEHDGEWDEASVSVRNSYVHLAQTALLLIDETSAGTRTFQKPKAIPRREWASHISKRDA